MLARAVEDRQVGRRLVARADGLDQVRVEVGLAGEAEGRHVEPAQPQHERRQDADRPRPHDRGPPRAPHAQPPLDLVRLGDALLDHGERLEEHADLAQPPRDLHDELGVVDVVLGEVPVAQVDPALEVDVVGGHVVGADQVVEARARPADGGHDVVAGLHLGHVLPDRLDPAEPFVADDQEVMPVGGGAVLRRVDLLVRPVDADAQDLDEDAPAAGDVVHRGLGSSAR